MVYKEKFVVCVEVAGKILREIGDVVYLPFGSDYALRFKNLGTVRAVVGVEVDGSDPCGGTKLVVNAGSEARLEGFMEGGVVRRAFRFIQKTKEVQEHRGDRMDDGLVRISWRWEQPPAEVREVVEHRTVIYHDYFGWPYYSPWRYQWPQQPNWPVWGTGIVYGSSGTIGSSNTPMATMNYSGPSAGPAPDEGITVAGEDRHQRFHDVSVGQLMSEELCVVLRLRGIKAGVEVIQAITTKTKEICPICGRKDGRGSRFCPDCGVRKD